LERRRCDLVSRAAVKLPRNPFSAVSLRITLSRQVSLHVPTEIQAAQVSWVAPLRVRSEVLISALNPTKQNFKLVDFLFVFYSSTEFLALSTPISSVSRRETELVDAFTEALSARGYQFSHSKSQLHDSALRGGRRPRPTFASIYHVRRFL